MDRYLNLNRWLVWFFGRCLLYFLGVSFSVIRCTPVPTFLRFGMRQRSIWSIHLRNELLHFLLDIKGSNASSCRVVVIIKWMKTPFSHNLEASADVSVGALWIASIIWHFRKTSSHFIDLFLNDFNCALCYLQRLLILGRSFKLQSKSHNCQYSMMISLFDISFPKSTGVPLWSL